jgi:hypothetical protein
MAILGRFLNSGIKVGSRIQVLRKFNPVKLQKKTLGKLILKARLTEFGLKYNFDEVLNSILYDKSDTYYEVFKKTVPIYDYDKIYSEWWHKAREGQSNITWPGKIKHFALSSGTSGSASKAIPVSKEMIKAIQKTGVNQIISLGNFDQLPKDLFEKSYLMLGGSTLLNNVDSHLEGDLSGITTGNIPLWFERFYKPGKNIAMEKDWAKKLEEITENAPNWDIGFLAGVPAWIQILLEKIIAKYELNNIHEIWPNLSVFGWGGVSFEPYKKGFEKLLSKPITYVETYLASEGFLAYQNRPNAGIQLVLNNGIYFEFIKFDESNFDTEGNLKPNPETINIKKVKEGVNYAILISTCSGAWRYLIGDTIKFTNLEKAEIVITGRTKHFLSLCGEHISVDNLNKAIDMASCHFGISIKEFTVLGIKHPPLFAHQWYIGCDDKINEDELISYIDASLKTLNDDYLVEREHALKNVFCKVLPTKTFIEYLKAQGKEGGQVKFPRVLKDEKSLEWESYLRLNRII